MSARGKSKNGDGQIDTSKGKEKAAAQEAKVVAVQIPAGPESLSAQNPKIRGEHSPTAESESSDVPKPPGGGEHRHGDAKASAGSVSLYSKSSGESILSNNKWPAAEKATDHTGTTRVGTSISETKITHDKTHADPKQSREPPRESKVSEPTNSRGEPAVSGGSSGSKISGHPTAESKVSGHPTTESKKSGHPTVESKTSGHPTTESKVSGHPTAESKISGHPTTESKVSGHPTVESKISGHPTTESKVSGHPTVESKTSGHPTTESKISGHPTAESKVSEHPTVESKKSGHPTAESKKSGHPTTESKVSGHPTTESKVSGHPTAESKKSGHPTTESKVSGHPTTESKVSGHPTAESKKSRHPTTESKKSGHPTTESKISGHPTTESKVSGHRTTESKVSGHPTTESKISGHPTTESKISGHPTTESKKSGHPTVESKTSGHPTTESKVSGHPTVESKISGLPTTESKVSGHPTAESKVSEHPTVESKISEHPTVESSISGHPTADSKVSGHPTTESKISGHPTTESKVSGHPTVESKNSGHPTTESTIAGHTRTESKTSGHPTTESKNSGRTRTESKTSGHPTAESKTSGHPTAESKTSGQPTTESKSPTKQKPAAELRSSREPKFSGDRKPTGEPKTSSKSSNQPKPSIESKSRDSPGAGKQSDNSKMEQSNPNGANENKTAKEETKGASSKVGAAATVPKTSAAKDRASQISKKATGEAERKAEVVEAAKASIGKAVDSKKAPLLASKTDAKVAEKLSSSRGAELKASTASKEERIGNETKVSMKKDAATEEKKNANVTEQSQKSALEKYEPTISPDKKADRPKEPADKVSPKNAEGFAEGVPKSKLNINGKESGKPSSIIKSTTQENLKKSPKDENPKAAVISAPEKKSPSASTSPKSTQSELFGKNSVLNVNGEEFGRPSPVSKSPTQEILKKSPNDEKSKAIAIQAAVEKKSLSASTSPKQRKSQSETPAKDSIPKSPLSEVAKPQMAVEMKKEEPKAKVISSRDKQEIKVLPQQERGKKKLEFPKLGIADKTEVTKSSETKKSPSSMGERSLTQEAASKAGKSKTSPRTPEVKVVEFVLPETEKKVSTSYVHPQQGDEPDSAEKESQGTKSPLADSETKISTTSLKDSKSIKTEFTADSQKLGLRETAFKRSSLPTSAKASEEATSVSEPNDPAPKISKPERPNGSDSSKETVLNPIRRPSVPDSRDLKLSPRLTPASDAQIRFQFPPDPNNSLSIRESPVQATSPASPLDKSDSSGDTSLGRKPSSTRKTPGEHKTIVQMLQEAREEALPRGERKAADLKEYSKSEMALPGAPYNGSRKEPVQQTSSPNLKAQNGVTFKTEEVKKGVPGKIKSTDAKEISKSEVVLPATPDAKMLPETQMTSSPNLTSVRGRHSVEGLPDSMARSSPSVAILNGMHRQQRASERRDSRKGSVISDTAALPEQGGCRARSATWSVVPASVATKREEETDAEWDKRWSSAGSDLLAEKALGRVPSKKDIGIGSGKEWRSEGIAKTPFNGAAPKVGSSEHIKKTKEVARGDKRAWESEAGLVRHASSKGYTKFENPSQTKATKNGSDLKRDMKDLVSPSSSTASKGSGIDKVSEASGSYHSVASSTHRRDSKSEEVPKHAEVKQPENTMESGDKVKLIEETMKEGFDVEIIVEMGGREKKRGSGKRRSREQHGVENQGADLALQEEEEAAGTSSGRGVRLRPYIDLWESEDKFSVGNSQLPLNPSGEEDVGSTTEPERGNWTGRFDFILSLLGYSVGLGNVWRFPYLCYNNGGGAFLIPFTIMLVIAGLPLMFMELSFGQYANLGPAAIYAKFCPLFHGLGYGMVIVSTVVMLYYNLIIAWTIFYMFASLNKQLPWENCEPEWSTLDCYSYEIADDCMEKNGTYYQRTCYNETEAAASNITHLAEIAEKRPPAEEYFNNYVLGLSKGIEETGEIRFSMALCLLLAWAIVFLCLSKGVQSSGKVVYFTALFPYVVLIMLFIRGVTLPGASTGILFYLTPDWQRLANAQVWGDAAVQIFFALSPAWGGLITLASYNKFSNNCYKDSLIVAVSNILTSFFAGFVIFSVIGFLAHELNVEVKKVVDQGAGLAFIVYPEVVTRLPVSPVWSLLFFVMLLTLGLDSQFALMETVTTAILDRFPNLREKKVWVVLVVAVLGYFGGLIFTTNSGMYWLQLMDKYAANWSVLLIAISECILIAWVYGADRFLRDVQEMIGPKSRLWMFFWCWMWKLVTPATLLFILFFNWVEYAPASYGEYIYPLWADAAGWVIGVFPVLVIIGAGVVKVYTAPEASLRDKFKRLLQPTPDWGPTLKRTSAPPTYDSIKNTIVLMNGLPVIQETHADGESLEDNTL